MGQPVLYTWGVVQFQVYPVNVDEVDHVSQTDWSRKEIAGAAIYREWVGEGDEEIHLRGKLYPYYYAMQRARANAYINNPTETSRAASGIPTMDIIDACRRLGQAHALVRGDGQHLGWYVIERLSRSHTALGTEGVGRMINFEATFMRVPVPDDPGIYYSLYSGVTTTADATVSTEST